MLFSFLKSILHFWQDNFTGHAWATRFRRTKIVRQNLVGHGRIDFFRKIGTLRPKYFSHFIITPPRNPSLVLDGRHRSVEAPVHLGGRVGDLRGAVLERLAAVVAGGVLAATNLERERRFFSTDNNHMPI